MNVARLRSLTLNRCEVGDCREVLPVLPDAIFSCCVTSPPYWGLRDYGHADQIGLETTPEAYVTELVLLFREVRRVLRDDGTLWLNLGDSYASTTKGSGGPASSSGLRRDGRPEASRLQSAACTLATQRMKPVHLEHGLKSKDLVGIPWRVAFALQADGWYLRSDIIWCKPNPMPESVTDRPTKAHEYLFLLAKGKQYYFDADAIKEVATGRAAGNKRHRGAGAYADGDEYHRTKGGLLNTTATLERNTRTVWTIAPQPYAGAHFATMPPKLVERCVLAGAPIGGVVLDPFLGSGTTAMVAQRLGRQWFGIEANPAYKPLIAERVQDAR